MESITLSNHVGERRCQLPRVAVALQDRRMAAIVFQFRVAAGAP